MKPENNQVEWLDESSEPGLVSIVIPVYNREQFIEETLLSVDAQIYRPIECVIVDDGSTDQSKEVVIQFIESYKGSVVFKYFHKPNTGVQNTRNFGTRKTKGEFIQYLDSDDLLDSDKLVLQTTVLRKHPEYDGVFSSWSSGRTVNTAVAPDHQEQLHEIKDVNSYFEFGPIVNFAPLLRRTAMNIIGEWDEQLTVNEELDYHMRLLMLRLQLAYVHSNAGLWRVHDDFRLSNTNNYANLSYFYKKHEALLKSKKIWNKALALNFGKRIFWTLVANTFANPIYRAKLMCLAVNYNPELPHFESKKIKLLRPILGECLSTVIWFYLVLPFVRRSKEINN